MVNLTENLDSQTLSFECGCVLPRIVRPDGSIGTKIDYYNINTGCPYTWQTLINGETKGVFQLEKNLGQNWSKKVKPSSINDIAALIALIRPGVLRSMLDGKSLAKHYADRKNYIDQTTYFHDSLEKHLSETYGILVFQESAISIAKDLAGFSESEADTKIRKGIGKKDSKIVQGIEAEFVDRCEKAGKVSREEAQQIFDWIKEGQRYIFNKSHSVEYGIISYWTAYAKTHFVKEFFCAYLYHAKDKPKKQDEISFLLPDARRYNIDVMPPSLDVVGKNNNNICIHNDKIYFNMLSIKGVGQKQAQKAQEIIETLSKKKPIKSYSSTEILIQLLLKLNKAVSIAMINLGYFDFLKISRQELLLQFDALKMLTKNELAKYAGEDNIKDFLANLRDKVNKNRQNNIKSLLYQLNNSSFSTEDSKPWILLQEESYCGVHLSWQKADVYNKSFDPDTTAREYNDGKNNKTMSFLVTLKSIRELTIKKGPNAGEKMAVFTCEDETGEIECVVFSEGYQEFRSLLFVGNTLFLVGQKSSYESSNSLICNKIYQV